MQVIHIFNIPGVARGILGRSLEFLKFDILEFLFELYLMKRRIGPKHEDLKSVAHEK